METKNINKSFEYTLLICDNASNKSTNFDKKYTVLPYLVSKRY